VTGLLKNPILAVFVVTVVVIISLSWTVSSIAEVVDNEMNQQADSKKLIDSTTLSTIPANKSTAVFYGTNLPSDILSKYSRIIVESDNVKPEELKALRSKGSYVYAYVSIGEVSPTRKWFKQIKKKWILGDNKVWDSKVMDLASLGWQNFIIDSVVTPLWEKGYRGLFLDTMDSFYLFAKDEKQRKQQADALAELLKKIHLRYPDMRFISNRGFEVVSSIGYQLEAVLAESLFASWDNVKKVYKETSKNDQEWLINKLNGIKKELSIDIIILDYADPSDSRKMRELAIKIAKEGFIPWISVVSLDIAGFGSLEINPDTHLLLIDSSTSLKNNLLKNKYKTLFNKIEDKNEKIKIHDIQSSLPIGHTTRRYISIMTTLPFHKQSDAYKKWLKKQIKEGAKFIPLTIDAKVQSKI